MNKEGQGIDEAFDWPDLPSIVVMTQGCGGEDREKAAKAEENHVECLVAALTGLKEMTFTTRMIARSMLEGQAIVFKEVRQLKVKLEGSDREKEKRIEELAVEVKKWKDLFVLMGEQNKAIITKLDRISGKPVGVWERAKGKLVDSMVTALLILLLYGAVHMVEEISKTSVPLVEIPSVEKVVPGK